MAKLRIGILLPDESLPAWAARLLDGTRAQPQVEVVSALVLPQKKSSSRLFDFYFRLDRRAFHPGPSPWAPVEAGRVLQDTKILHGTLDEHRMQLQSLRLDVLANLVLDEIPDQALDLARLGVWTLHDGRSRFVVGAQPGWRELLQNDSLTTCEIEILRRGQPAQVILQAVMATDPLSVARNQMHLLWRAAALFPRALMQLAQRGEAAFFANAQPASPSAPASLPNLLQVAALGSKQAFRKVAREIRIRFTADQWMLMLAPRSAGAPLTWDGFEPIIPPPDRSWADPFLVERAGQRYVFIEEYPFATRRGRIACLTLDAAGKVVSNQTLLEKPYHLSYPFVFEHDGEWYMLPESSGNRTVDLYRCTRFPDQWVFVKTLLRDVRALDATLFEHEGRWWLFANITEDEGVTTSTWDSLYLFHAEDPLSEKWIRHPLNPVVTDVRSARPAGRIFCRDGKLFRPSQDSSRRYGYGLRLNRILTLSTTEYAETCEETLLPPRGRNILATHTLNFAGDWTIIDVQSRRSKIG